MKSTKLLIKFLMVIVLLISCGKDEAPVAEIDTEIKVTSVDVTAQTQNLMEGATTQLSATVLPSNANNKNVLWSSSDETLATVDSKGLVNAIAEGEVTITVKSQENEELSDCVAIQITEDFANNPAFITTWKTDNQGVSGKNQISVPTSAGLDIFYVDGNWVDFVYDYDVDWGDGTFDFSVDGNITHTYENPGIYQVRITGAFPHLYFNGEGDKNKIMSVDNWGDIEWWAMRSAFNGCQWLDVSAMDSPDLSLVKSTVWMFKGCKNLIGNEFQ